LLACLHCLRLRAARPGVLLLLCARWRPLPCRRGASVYIPFYRGAYHTHSGAPCLPVACGLGGAARCQVPACVQASTGAGRPPPARATISMVPTQLSAFRVALLGRSRLEGARPRVAMRRGRAVEKKSPQANNTNDKQRSAAVQVSLCTCHIAHFTLQEHERGASEQDAAMVDLARHLDSHTPHEAPVAGTATFALKFPHCRRRPSRGGQMSSGDEGCGMGGGGGHQQTPPTPRLWHR
jgi:hypothetical protein